MDRAELSRRLDGFVAENRFTIAVVFPAFGALLMVASAEGYLTGFLRFNPAFILLGTLVMRTPLLAGLLPTLERKGVAALLALTAYTYGVEFVGVRTGFPYGAFEYGIELGPMVLGTVPLGLPAFFFPLVLNSYLLVLLLSERRAAGPLGPVARVLAALAVVLAIDAVLDPAAVALGFWSYTPPGTYYGVPWTNYAGWVLSGGLAVLTVEFAFDRDALAARLADCPFMLDDLVSFVLLWGAVNVWFGQWVPALLAAGLAGALVATDRFDFAVRPRFA
jgi:putative membrane protein